MKHPPLTGDQKAMRLAVFGTLLLIAVVPGRLWIGGAFFAGVAGYVVARRLHTLWVFDDEDTMLERLEERSRTPPPSGQGSPDA